MGVYDYNSIYTDIHRKIPKKSHATIQVDIQYKGAKLPKDIKETPPIQQYSTKEWFPDVGSSHVIYVDKSTQFMYCWDILKSEYYQVGVHDFAALISGGSSATNEETGD